LNGIEEVLLLIRIFSKRIKTFSFIEMFFFHSAGINLLFLLAIGTEELKKNNEAYRISK
jgi:hypothetical protein